MMDGGNIAMNVYFDGELQLFEAAIAIFGDDVTSFPIQELTTLIV